MSNATHENSQTESGAAPAHPTEAPIEVSPARSVTRWEGMVVINSYDPDGPMEPAEALALAVALTKAATGPDASEVCSDETATVVSRRPSWAEKTTMGAEVITHSWTAPTVAMVLEPGAESLSRAPVELYRDDDLLVHDDVVALHEGPWRIFLLETAIEDTVNARRLAAAIIECCDRIEQAAAEDD